MSALGFSETSGASYEVYDLGSGSVMDQGEIPAGQNPEAIAEDMRGFLSETIGLAVDVVVAPQTEGEVIDIRDEGTS